MKKQIVYFTIYKHTDSKWVNLMSLMPETKGYEEMGGYDISELMQHVLNFHMRSDNRRYEYVTAAKFKKLMKQAGLEF